MRPYSRPELELLELTADEALAAIVQSEPTVEDDDDDKKERKDKSPCVPFSLSYHTTKWQMLSKANMRKS